MPRLRNVDTGVVVNVDDATASRLGGGWVPVVVEKPKPRTRSKKSKTDDE